MIPRPAPIAPATFATIDPLPRHPTRFMQAITPSVTPATLLLRSRLIHYREQIQAIATDYGISHIRIFGSVARGNATTESDIDF